MIFGLKNIRRLVEAILINNKTLMKNKKIFPNKKKRIKNNKIKFQRKIKKNKNLWIFSLINKMSKFPINKKFCRRNKNYKA